MCFCKLGFQRLINDFGAPCVRSKDCIKCDENKVYEICGSDCPEYCGMPEDEVCDKKCVKGCFCKEGYVLVSEVSEKCIPRSECPTIY